MKDEGSQYCSLPTQNSLLKTPYSKLPTQNSQLKTQNSKLKTQNSQLKTPPPPSPPLIQKFVRFPSLSMVNCLEWGNRGEGLIEKFKL
jgi:hypothetical protein